MSKQFLLVQRTLEASMGPMAGERRAVMFSGGFDSMLMVLLARRYGARVTAVTVRFDDFNPRTVADASLLARKMSLSHYILHVTLLEFLFAFGSLTTLIDEPLLDMDLVLVHAAFKKYDPQIGGKVFITGMGSDQWFGDEALKGKAKDLKVRLDQAAVDKDAHYKVARAHGCKFIFPFLSASMLVLSQQISPAMKRNKRLLRALVDGIDLTEHRSTKKEIQVPTQVRYLLVKIYGHRAWPRSISKHGSRDRADERILRQIYSWPLAGESR